MKLQELEEKIRRMVSSGRRQSILLNTPVDWNRLCSSLDVIGDSQLAIESYSQFYSLKDLGASYLLIYGIMQTLLLQQDAVILIAESLGFKVKLPKKLSQIRVIRNSTAGHPAKQSEKGVETSSFITRYSLNPMGFQLMTSFSNGSDSVIKTISIPRLIETQSQFLCEMLEMILAELEREEMEHKEKHNAIKLTEVFPQTLGYHISKIFESTMPHGYFSLGTPNLEMVAECLERFKSELVKRGEWGVYDSIDSLFELIEYPLNRLKAYFERNDPMNEKDAYIYTSFLSQQVKALEVIAQDIDREYERAE